jgi:hypothetical protein
MPARIGARRIVTGLPAPSLDIDFRSGVFSPLATITRASSKNTVGPAGTLVSVGNDTAAFSWNATTFAPLGIDIEESRTNLLLNSGTLSTQNVTTTAQAYTLSFTGTGTITLTGTSTAGPLTGTGTGEANRVTLTFTPTAGTLTLTVTGTVTNAQLEAGSFRTSYITTAGATVTRAADVVQLPNQFAWFNPNQGTFVVRGIIPFAGLGAQAFLDIYTTAADKFSLRPAAWLSDAGSVSQFNITLTGLTAGQENRYAVGYATNNAGAGANGLFIGNDLSCTLPVIATVDVGRRDAVAFLNGTIARITYYPIRLSDSQLAYLSQ